MLRHVAAFAACSSLAVAAACSGPSSPSGEDVGEAKAAITQVPAQVGCIEIDVTGARSVTSRTNVTAGTSPTIPLTGLPLGLDTFVGLAYPGACNAVTSSSQATWISNAAQASLTAQQVVGVNLTLVPNGESSVGVSFQPDDAGTDAQALVCSAPQILCAGVCTSVATDPANCGACGHLCAAPNAVVSCVSGTCQVAQCAAGFALCGGTCQSLSTSSNCGACGVVCAAGRSCTAGACVAAAGAACNVDTDCGTSLYCQSSSHTCAAKLAAGAACTAADQCGSGTCLLGLCQ